MKTSKRSTNNNRRATRRRDPEAARAEVADLKNRLDEHVTTLTDSEAWRAMLRAAVGFHRYSFRNILLILLQCPDATHVAAYREWQTRGRQVRKGEKGIRILAPMTVRRDQDTDDENDRDEDDKQPRVFFRAVSVFDISQTDPIDPDTPTVPRPAELTGHAPAGLWDALAQYVTAQGYALERGDCGSAGGWTDPATRTVRITGDDEGARATRILAHEAGHIACRHIDDDLAEYRQHRGRYETEAESVAYIVAAAHGLETDTTSTHYIAGWARRESPDDVAALLKETGQRVITAAHAVLDAIEPHTAS
ncbi:ArdC-like ssDNA-binding domain-containing protein [Streptomyces sp. BH105]|uniref:ArdC family protein n=1 Tax=Streptomyces sp. BH105 TaxID=3410408 RepID=UPI003CEF6B51